MGGVSEPTVPAPGPHLNPPAPGKQPADHPHLFVQAPVAPLDVDGLTAVALGLVVFALASLAFGIYYDRLAAAGHGWWFGVALSGFGLGLIGLVYCRYRRGLRRSQPPLD